MNLEELKKEKRNDILRIANGHGARNVRVFGSVLRGEATENSDLDLLIELDSDRSLLDLIAVKQDLEDLLRCKVDVVTESSVSPFIRKEIISRAVSI
jgi:predicted nucleotidyltransferase